MPPTYLPTSHNKKEVFVRYKAACETAGKRPVGLSSFKDIWLQYIPHLKVMSPRTDCCTKCENFRVQITRAVTEEEKMLTTTEFGHHVAIARQECEHYQNATKKAKAELNVSANPSVPGPHPPCSRDLVHVHYTFDYAQQVTLPCQSRQVGPLYFNPLGTTQSNSDRHRSMTLQPNSEFSVHRMINLSRLEGSLATRVSIKTVKSIG